MMRYSIVLTVLFIGCAGNPQHPDHQRFQNLLAAEGGWHDIQWDEDGQGVRVKHAVNIDLPLQFIIRRSPDGVSETIVFGTTETVWTKRDGWNKDFERPMKLLPSWLRTRQEIERLSDQLLDAFNGS